MSEHATDALEALIERYEYELNALQAEEFIDRIQAWQEELEALAAVTLIPIVAPLRRDLERCVQALGASQFPVSSVDYNRVGHALSEARRTLRRYVERGSWEVRETGPAYKVTGPIMTFDGLPSEERTEAYPPHVRFTAEGAPHRTHPVWFGTDRQIIHLSDTQFRATGEWSEEMRYGTCVVHVPKSHTFGSIGSSWIQRVYRRYITDLADDRLRITETQFHSPQAFRDSVGSELALWNKKTALVFVHGYNVSFRDAIVRAAQIGFDLRIDGITAAFSWPSKGRLFPYPTDEAHIELAEHHFVEFIEHVAGSPGLQEINVIAHSMGNRLLCRAMPALVERQRSGKVAVPIGHVVLAAADLSTEFFKQQAALYRALAGRRITNYSCAADKALFGSRALHGLGRVGLEPPIFVHEGIDTVSVSQLNLDLLGHGYFASAEPLLYDIAELIHNHKAPSERLRIERGPLAYGLHWVLTR